ncbi:hypothetical protein E5CHR_02573 [Variovorax sp. PBL-E5]|nr:hypothetical protein E5CHR_02573 [Variovorax sp. PBL-E5]
MLNYMKEGDGDFDESKLGWMNERLDLANKRLAEGCGI